MTHDIEKEVIDSCEGSQGRSQVPSGAPADSIGGAGSPVRAARSGSIRRLLMLFCGVVVCTVMVVEAPREISRWHVAAAIVEQSHGERELALASVQDALRWDPSSRVARVQRGQIRLESQDYEACLEEFEQLLAEDPGDLEAVFGQTIALQRLGRGDEAVRVFEDLLRTQNPTMPQVRAVYLNGLAYARAVAGVDLEQALLESNQSMQLSGGGGSAEMLDTHGFILFQLGRQDAALQDLNQAAALIATRLAMAKSVRQYVDPISREQQLNAIREAAAVIHYHRALALEAVGQPEQAELDRQRVRAWGFEPAPSLF